MSAGLVGQGFVISVFAVVYLGLALGHIPGLRLDRTGIVLLGALALLASGAVSKENAMAAVDMPTLSLLFGLMVVSAQLRLGGFYTWITRVLARRAMPPPLLLAVFLAAMGGLAAVFSNDIVCLAATPVILELCRARGLNPLPFLLGLACAANIGSAATLIGNPQNILIGEMQGLSFAAYLTCAAPVAVAGLVVAWGILSMQFRKKWRWEKTTTPASPTPTPDFDPWKSGKGLAAAGLLFFIFLATGLPRDLSTLAVAGVLLASRRLYSRDMLALVDWQLLVLFIGLFIVNDAVQKTGLPADAVAHLAAGGIRLDQPGWLVAVVAVLSNLVSNVPAVLLLLPVSGNGNSGAIMALASTMAGNLFIVGSIANIIVVEEAARQGFAVSWKEHLKTGLPVTMATLALVLLRFSLL